MAVLFSAFSIDKKDGAGWVSKRIGRREGFSDQVIRRDTFLSKSLWAVLGAFLVPFLHPIFTRFLPLSAAWRRRFQPAWLNFSQTFALALVLDRPVLVCHDLQCHCPHRFVRWVRWSERFLLQRAGKVVVLTARDQKIVNRYYRVPLGRIENLTPLLLPDLHPFGRKLAHRPGSVAFLGTLGRKENREGLAWFVENVLPACPDLKVWVIGEPTPKHTIFHPQLDYVGFVEDLQGFIAQQDFMIAPLFSRAGIKIKVVEALLAETPVLGTRAAYGGLRRPAGGWCSDDPRDWIRILNAGGGYAFPGL